MTSWLGFVAPGSGRVHPPGVLIPRRHLRPEGSCSVGVLFALQRPRAVAVHGRRVTLFVGCIHYAQVLINSGALNSSSIRDTYERDFYLLKNVIKQHDNVIECVEGRGVPCTHTLGVYENAVEYAVEYAGSSACVSLTGVVPQVRVRLPGRGAGRCV